MQRNISLNNSKQIENKNKRNIRSKTNDANDLVNQRIRQLYNLKEFIGSDVKNQSLKQQTQDLQNQIQQFNQQMQYQPQLQQEINLLIQIQKQKLEIERGLGFWKDKYSKLENDSKHLYEIEKKTEDLQNRLTITNEENVRLEQENRNRLLKNQEQLERKKQNQKSTIYNIKQQLNEKKRIIQYLDLELDFIYFKNQILNLMMKEIKNSRIGKQMFGFRKLYVERNQRGYMEQQFNYNKNIMN
ncbi:unnamed protein product [Paramecium pentaurelia]|uniref:Uncharacterized protein n=1 Tax=Paramecium pentaurelia TaxID=43138 RepID=A0A8S1W2F8_9CILI|nr:unnamed protein product [Paramecium pentaurelia]